MYGDGYTSRTIGRFCVTVIWLVKAAASVSICLTPGCGARRDCEQIYVWASKDLEAGSAETEDPQLIHNHFFHELDHPEMGKCSFYHGPLFELSKTSYELGRPPLLGESNEYVYTKILGLSDEEWVELITEGVI